MAEYGTPEASTCFNLMLQTTLTTNAATTSTNAATNQSKPWLGGHKAQCIQKHFWNAEYYSMQWGSASFQGQFWASMNSRGQQQAGLPDLIDAQVCVAQNVSLSRAYQRYPQQLHGKTGHHPTQHAWQRTLKKHS
jgi:hypothetical protein